MADTTRKPVTSAADKAADSKPTAGHNPADGAGEVIDAPPTDRHGDPVLPDTEVTVQTKIRRNANPSDFHTADDQQRTLASERTADEWVEAGVVEATANGNDPDALPRD